MSLLRPGLHVVRRDDRHLQIGLDPPWRLVVPDEPDVHRLLADLAAGREPDPSTASAHRVLHDLRVAGLLRTGPAPDRVGRVAVLGAAAAVEDATRLLAAAGVEASAAEPDPDLVLLLAAGEPRREGLDDHMRAGRPHLVVTAGAAGYRVGPFVLPGATACLRCVDAHLGEQDPRRAVVVEQLADRPAGPDDPTLAALATAWAVRDVLRYLSGERPASWSATVELDLEAEPRCRPWPRHPYCGCAWAQEPVA